MEPIDVEFLFAVTPLTEWLKPGRVRVTLATKNEAARFYKQIHAKCNEFFDEPPSGVCKMPVVDWKAARDILTVDPSIASAADKLEDLDPDMAIAATEMTARAHAYLRDALPRRERMTGLGPIPCDLGHSEILQFSRVWQVAETPTVVLDDLCAGCLTRKQSAALGAMFPLMAAAIKQTLFDALTKRHGGNDEFRLARWRARQLEALLQISATPKALAAAYQTGFTADETGRDAQQQAQVAPEITDPTSQGRAAAR